MSLDVYLYGEQVGQLLPSGDSDYQLAYTAERVEGFGEGGAVLSNALPGSGEPYSPDASRAYIEGLLPEGPRRERIAAGLGIDPHDGYGLIAALGRDCPGAVTFLPPGEATQRSSESSTAWLGDGELEELVTAQPQRLLDPDREGRMSFTLPGVRHKLSLVRAEAGDRWGWPAHDTPSTHVLKPECDEHSELVANEMFCTTVAREAGLLVAPTTVETIAGQRCLVSERFDRAVQGLKVERFHQETFSQALGFMPSQAATSPSFAESCGLLRATGEEQAITLLIAGAFCHYLLGNGDVGGTNFGLLFAYEGALLAPFYDIASTVVYADSQHTGLTIASAHSEPASMNDLATIADECGVGIEHCRNVAGNMAERVSGALLPAVERARGEGWDAPVVEDITQIAAERSLSLGEEIQG
ncbi:MAG TPA: HipA domain-containing protein [Solirubrobacterales bacterium]|nr:HipA domain-containing protein [Solirubrobacterales bacterium]